MKPKRSFTRRRVRSKQNAIVEELQRLKDNGLLTFGAIRRTAKLVGCSYNYTYMIADRHDFKVLGTTSALAKPEPKPKELIKVGECLELTRSACKRYKECFAFRKWVEEFGKELPQEEYEHVFKMWLKRFRRYEKGES